MTTAGNFVREDGQVCCGHCNEALISVAEAANIYDQLVVSRVPIENDLVRSLSDAKLERSPEFAEYTCPVCQQLLKVEVTMADGPVSGQSRR